MQSGTQTTQKKAFVVFDIETTGFKPEHGHEILEIAAERLEGGSVVGTFHAMVKPEKPIPPESTQIHGITEDMVAHDGRNPKEVIEEFLSFATGAVLVGHNVGFDISFVRAYAKKFGLPDLVNQTLDTCEIARKQLIIPQYSLERVAKHFGITNPQAHRAQADVEVTRKVFIKLVEKALAAKRGTR